MEGEKNCKNCGYYLPHYIKSRVKLIEVDGHCMNIVHKRQREAVKLCEPCRYWKPQEDKKEERRKIIKVVLRDMEKSLEDIKLILQSDEE